jgi:hypothetical protein
MQKGKLKTLIFSGLEKKGSLQGVLTYSGPNKKATTTIRRNRFFLVVWGGIEPPTQGFSVIKSMT